MGQNGSNPFFMACRDCHLKVTPPANSRLIQKFWRFICICMVEFWPNFFSATRNFAENSYGPSATLTWNHPWPKFYWKLRHWPKSGQNRAKIEPWQISEHQVYARRQFGHGLCHQKGLPRVQRPDLLALLLTTSVALTPSSMQNFSEFSCSMQREKNIGRNLWRY